MMTRQNFEARLSDLLHRQPFRPFMIEFDEGDHFVVGQPKALMHYAGSAVFFHPDGNFDFVDPEAVRAIIEFTPAASN